VQTFDRKEITVDENIVNTSAHKVFILYNSAKNFLPTTDTIGRHFFTECMDCEPVQTYQDHLLFASQMEIYPEKSAFHKEKLPVSNSMSSIKRVNSYGNEKIVNFSFSDGAVKIKHIKQSCNDAELKQVILYYKDGEVKISNVLNASFFQFDLNKDGKQEQYILANRN
jgi:hypothetical protein